MSGCQIIKIGLPSPAIGNREMTSLGKVRHLIYGQTRLIGQLLGGEKLAF